MRIMDTVRAVIPDTDITSEWLEVFQYLGVCQTLIVGDEHRTLQFRCHGSIKQPKARKVWANAVADKMVSMGINAVPEFEWYEEDDDHNHTSDAAAYACGCYE